MAAVRDTHLGWDLGSSVTLGRYVNLAPPVSVHGILFAPLARGESLWRQRGLPERASRGLEDLRIPEVLSHRCGTGFRRRGRSLPVRGHSRRDSRPSTSETGASLTRIPPVLVRRPEFREWGQPRSHDGVIWSLTFQGALWSPKGEMKETKSIIY